MSGDPLLQPNRCQPKKKPIDTRMGKGGLDGRQYAST
jgi:hypothetical protein